MRRLLIRPFLPDDVQPLIPMWRESFEHGVGICHGPDCREHRGALFPASAVFPDAAVSVEGKTHSDAGRHSRSGETASAEPGQGHRARRLGLAGLAHQHRVQRLAHQLAGGRIKVRQHDQPGAAVREDPRTHVLLPGAPPACPKRQGDERGGNTAAFVDAVSS